MLNHIIILLAAQIQLENPPQCCQPAPHISINTSPPIHIDIQYIKLQTQSIRNATANNPKSKELLLYALSSSDRRVKAAAITVAGDYGTQYAEEIINSISDTDQLVQQAARQTLINYSRKTSPGGQRGIVDFGPMSMDNAAQVGSSQTLWKLWFNGLTPTQKSLIDGIRKTTVDKKDPTPGPLTTEKR